jgi:hypothetical protein
MNAAEFMSLVLRKPVLTCNKKSVTNYYVILKQNSLGVTTICNSMSTNVSENITASILNATEDIIATEEPNIISYFIVVKIPNFKRIKFKHSLRLKIYAQGQSVHDICKILKVKSKLNIIIIKIIII